MTRQPCASCATTTDRFYTLQILAVRTDDEQRFHFCTSPRCRAAAYRTEDLCNDRPGLRANLTYPPTR